MLPRSLTRAPCSLLSNLQLAMSSLLSVGRSGPGLNICPTVGGLQGMWEDELAIQSKQWLLLPASWWRTWRLLSFDRLRSPVQAPTAPAGSGGWSSAGGGALHGGKAQAARGGRLHASQGAGGCVALHAQLHLAQPAKGLCLPSELQSDKHMHLRSTASGASTCSSSQQWKLEAFR